MSILLIKFGPYIAIFVAGFGLAFGIQELRITHVEQEYAQYKIDQQQLVQYQIDLANKQRKDASDAYQTKQKQLEVFIKDGEVFRRCVAAGKCGVRNPVSSCTQSSISSSGEPDAVGTNSIPAPSGDAALNECAQTTLMLNQLQTDIEHQEGYNQ